MDRVLFLLNALDEAKPDQTTAGLIAAMSRRVATSVADVRGIRHAKKGLTLAAHDLSALEAPHVPDALRAPPRVRPARDFDAVWVRLNPGRMNATGMVGVLETLAQLEDLGVRVRNTAMGLLRAASKLYLTSLPTETVATTWASRDPEHLRACIAQLDGLAVVKPAIGTRGGEVHRVTSETEGLDALLVRLAAAGPVLVQEYLPEAPAGDLRVHLIGGRLLTVDGRPAIVRRRPAAGEWRSNVALGGQALPGELTDAQRLTLGLVGPVLVRHGLWHVGLDVVGSRVVECNVFSPGGLPEAGQFEGVDFVEEVVRRFVSA